MKEYRRHQLEQVTVNTAISDQGVRATELQVQISQAISLKRIADALEKITVVPLTFSVDDHAAALDNLAYTLGQSFKNGMGR